MRDGFLFVEQSAFVFKVCEEDSLERHFQPGLERGSRLPGGNNGAVYVRSRADVPEELGRRPLDQSDEREILQVDLACA